MALCDLNPSCLGNAIQKKKPRVGLLLGWGMGLGVEVDGGEVFRHVEVELGALGQEGAPVGTAGAVGALAEVALPGLAGEVAEGAEDALEVGAGDAEDHPPVAGLGVLGVNDLG